MTTQNTIRKILAPPVFPEDENKTREAYYLSIIVPASVASLLAFLFLRMIQGIDPLDVSNLILVAIGIILLIVWAIMKSGAVHMAGYISIGAIWIASTFLALSGGGIRGTGFVSYFVVMLLAGLLLGVRAATGVAILSIFSGFGLAYAETNGMIDFSQETPFVVAVEVAFLFVVSIILIRSTINSLKNALGAATASSKELLTSNEELSGLRDALEIHIQERTASLEKRASQLQTVSSMARSIAASMKDLDILLPNITKLVSEQFGFYHTGIFLLDDANEFADLKAANSEGGRRMLEKGHRLRLGSKSIVGYVALHGNPRIALDVGGDSVYFNNPDLPDTRSEMSLPLRASGHVIGVLDVQSIDTNAFVQEDIFVLSTLADQIAIAIENARLYSEAQKALADSQTTFDKYIKQEWSSFAQQEKNTGFMFDGKQVVPLDKKMNREHIQPVIQTGKLSMEKSTSTITVPIKLRGQTIGVLDVRSKSGDREWTRGEITLLEAAAERAGLALENARLVESAQRRASRERSIGEISARIGATSDIDSILQTAVEELGRKLSGVSEVTMELDREQI
jgi:GAF domain-containing protein